MESRRALLWRGVQDRARPVRVAHSPSSRTRRPTSQGTRGQVSEEGVDGSYMRSREMIVLVIQWLHVLLGICWFGGVLYLDFVVIPALMTLPLEQQRAVSKPLTLFTNRLLFPV